MQRREWLTIARVESGYPTCGALARKTKVSESCIQKIENGIRNPRVPLALCIGEAIGWSKADTLRRFYGSE